MSDSDTLGDGGKLLFCSFCGKNQNEVRRLIAGPSVYICDECVDLCNDIISEESQVVESNSSPDRLPVPTEIKDILDEYVVGQDVPSVFCLWLYTTITSDFRSVPKLAPIS